MLGKYDFLHLPRSIMNARSGVPSRSVSSESPEIDSTVNAIIPHGKRAGVVSPIRGENEAAEAVTKGR